MYVGGLVVSKASTIYRDLAHPLIFTEGGGQKVRYLGPFYNITNSEPHALENAARYPNSETKVQCCDDRPMPWPSLVKLGPHTPEKALSVVPTP